MTEQWLFKVSWQLLKPGTSGSWQAWRRPFWGLKITLFTSVMPLLYFNNNFAEKKVRKGILFSPFRIYLDLPGFWPAPVAARIDIFKNFFLLKLGNYVIWKVKKFWVESFYTTKMRQKILRGAPLGPPSPWIGLKKCFPQQ